MMATMIRSSADCAIGWNAADEVLKGLDLFADEYKSHLKIKNVWNPSDRRYLVSPYVLHM